MQKCFGATSTVFATGLFQDVRIDVSPQDEDGKVVVTFMVLENPAIRAVNLTGFKKVSEDDIREVIDISSYAIKFSAMTLNWQRVRTCMSTRVFPCRGWSP